MSLFGEVQELVTQERVRGAGKLVPVVCRNIGNAVMDGDLPLGTAALRGSVVRRRILTRECIDVFLCIEGGHASGTG